MKYNRKQLCILAGIDLERFKNAARADHLPIFTDPDGDDAAGDSEAGPKSYSRYTVADVIAVACATKLSRGGGYLSAGLPLKEASAIVTNNAWKFPEAVKSPKAFFIGYASMALNAGGENLAGDMAQITERLDAIDGGVANVTLVSPTAIIREIRVRASDYQIPFSEHDLFPQEDPAE